VYNRQKWIKFELTRSCAWTRIQTGL